MAVEVKEGVKQQGEVSHFSRGTFSTQQELKQRKTDIIIRLRCKLSPHPFQFSMH